MPEAIKNFPCSTQLSAKFILLVNVKMPTIVGILTFISMIKTTSERLKVVFVMKIFVGGAGSIKIKKSSDSFTIFGLWVLGLAVSHINEDNCKLMSPEHYFYDMSAILLHSGTR